jgi:hypothetical protein
MMNSTTTTNTASCIAMLMDNLQEEYPVVPDGVLYCTSDNVLSQALMYEEEQYQDLIMNDEERMKEYLLFQITLLFYMVFVTIML